MQITTTTGQRLVRLAAIAFPITSGTHLGTYFALHDVATIALYLLVYSMFSIISPRGFCALLNDVYFHREHPLTIRTDAVAVINALGVMLLCAILSFVLTPGHPLHLPFVFISHLAVGFTITSGFFVFSGLAIRVFQHIDN